MFIYSFVYLVYVSKMSKIHEFEDHKWIDTEPQEVRVRVWKNGDIEIKAYFVPKETLENIAKITGKKIGEYEGTYWIEFAKARDKSQVTLFGQ